MSELNTQEPVAPVDVKQDVVDKSAYESAKVDMFKFKEQARQSQQEALALKQKLEQLEVAELKKQEQYKTLAERNEQKAIESENKFKKLSEAWHNNEKMSVIHREALKLGIREEALADLALLGSDKVIIEHTDQGRLNILGAKEYVEDLKSSRPFWFVDQSPPNVNTNTPGVNINDKKLSGVELLDLSRKDPVAYKAYMKKVSNIS